MIQRIKIKNFRSLDVDFQLDPVTVLIGRSGTGKTNFVSALRYLRQLLQHGTQSAGKPLETNIFPLTKNEKELILEYEVVFEVPPLSEVFHYHLAVSNLKGITHENFMIDAQQIIQHSHNSRQCQFSTFQGNQKVSIARIALTQGLACYDFPGSVCTGVQQGSKVNEGLADRAENFSDVFNAISKDLTKLESWNMINLSLQNLNSTVDTISFNSQNEREILVTHKFGDLAVPPFDIGKESEGFRRYFAHLLAIYQTPPKQTLVFEEPERGIHPGALESLAESLKLCHEEGHGQVILTTHSPQLLDYFEPESIRVVVMEDGVTKIGPIENEQLEAIKDELLFPGELLTVANAVIARDVLEGMPSHAP
ncbi:MAG: ATP-binding protein [Planctomycetaceae bacterium]|nr:ATP-binding protein [Planctomycetaceae bacterium]